MISTREKILFWLLGLALFITFLGLVSEILLPFVVGILTAYFLDPAADKLEETMSRTAATALITAAFFFVGVLMCGLLLPVLFDQFMALARNIPDYVASLQENYGSLLDRLFELFDSGAQEKTKDMAASLSAYLIQFGGKALANLLQSGVALINLISLVFISPVVAFYLLRDWDKLVAKIDTLLPRDSAKVIRKQLNHIDDTLSGFIRGQSNVCLLLGIFYAIGLSVVGLDFGLFIGLGTGILSFIPFAGMFFGMAVGLGVAFFQFGFSLDLGLVLGVFLIGQVLEGNFLTPKLVGEKVGLHPVWVIFGLLAGGSLFGFTGILIAVPVTAVIGVLVRFSIEQYLNSSLYKDKQSNKG